MHDFSVLLIFFFLITFFLQGNENNSTIWLRIAGKFEMKLRQGNFVENREIFRPQKEIPHFESGRTNDQLWVIIPWYATARAVRGNWG